MFIRLVAVLSVLTASALAQPQTPTPTPTGTPTFNPADLPPPLRLAYRSESLRTQLPVLPTVVIVSDHKSYVEAIGAWSMRGRYPVLIDDGTFQAGQDIARFVRAFKPESVVRFESEEPGDLPEASTARRDAIESAIGNAWDRETENFESLTDLFKDAGLLPFGLVAADERDEAWTAGLALAAGRGQPIIWTANASRNVNTPFTSVQADALADRIDAAATATGLTWRGMGDDIDALTLCLNCPAKIRTRNEPRTDVATTDRLGRHARSAQTGLRTDPNAPRWAWAGQIFGSSAQAAYRAMCALYLQPRSAWLFDGYQNKAPYSNWDATAAGAILREKGFQAAVLDAPAQGERHWRTGAMRSLEAGLVFVNSSGNADFFDLNPGRCIPGDVPMLTVPSIAHFVHSWSASRLADRNSVGGRWLTRGAYAYFGSVQEPFLQSFVPTPLVAQRLLAHFPFGAAPRLDDGPVWKLAVIGDPLITLGPDAPRVETPLAIDGTEDLDEALQQALADQELPEAVLLLETLGRDEDASRLAAAAIDDPEKLTPELAKASLMPLFRTRRTDAFIVAYEALPTKAAADRDRQDALWLITYQLLPTTRDEDLVLLLRNNIRRGSERVRDAAELYRPMADHFGRPAADAMVRAVKAELKNDRQRSQLDKAIRGKATP